MVVEKSSFTTFLLLLFSFLCFSEPLRPKFRSQILQASTPAQGTSYIKKWRQAPSYFFLNTFFCIFLHVIFLFFISLKALRSKLRLKNLQPVRIAHGTCHIKKMATGSLFVFEKK